MIQENACFVNRAAKNAQGGAKLTKLALAAANEDRSPGLPMLTIAARRQAQAIGLT
jgi:hypothetical protein